MFSITLTIFNKEFLIERVLNSIKNYTTGIYEINAVLDGCTDSSESILDRFISSNPKIKINKYYTPDVCETKANNVGLKNSNEKYCIIIQDDMVINEHDWNNRLLKPILNFSDVFAVTARTAHNWSHNPHSRCNNTDQFLPNTWCNLLYATNIADKNNLQRNIFAIRDSVNRGPLLIRHDVLKAVNYLDESYAPLEMDNHDLNYRVYKQFGMVSGCYWIHYISELAWGATRANTSPKEWHIKAHHKNFRLLWERHKDLIIGQKHDQNRFLS